MTTSTITGQDFAARMDRLGVTQNFLSLYVGLSQSEISKIVGGIRPQGESHRKISDALRELEVAATYFYPMKPSFEDVNAVKAWLRSPALPNLFNLLTNAQLARLNASELTAVNAISRENERLEGEAVVIREQTQKSWLEFFETVNQ
jgi:transcriptional regulator with XRE-family HTH domain